MLLEETDAAKRRLIGKKIYLMREFRKDVIDFCFTDSANKDTVENFEGARDIFESVMAYINGDGLNFIGETVFQSDEEPVKKILELFGVKLDED